MSTVLQNTEEHYTTHHHPAWRFLLWKRSVYLCVIVNIHYIDRSVAVTYKKVSVFFWLQDLQKVNICTTINKNKIFELQTKAIRKKIFNSTSMKHRRLKTTLQNLRSTHHCQNFYVLSDICCLWGGKKNCKTKQQIWGCWKFNTTTSYISKCVQT